MQKILVKIRRNLIILFAKTHITERNLKGGSESKMHPMASHSKAEPAQTGDRLVECIRILHQGADPATLKQVNEYLLQFSFSPQSTAICLNILSDQPNHSHSHSHPSPVSAALQFFAANLLFDQITNHPEKLPELAKQQMLHVACGKVTEIAAGRSGGQEKAVTTRLLLLAVGCLICSADATAVEALARELRENSVAIFANFCQFMFEEGCAQWGNLSGVSSSRFDSRFKI